MQIPYKHAEVPVIFLEKIMTEKFIRETLPLSIRSHIEELQLMGAVDIRENKKIKILEFGLRLLIKLNGKR